MKHKSNWRNKTLEELANDYWSNPANVSRLVIRCHELRKKPLDSFTTEDVRLLIGQQIGLDYLIPMALTILTVDLFTAGDFFEGDLLKNVLAIDAGFWNSNKQYWTLLDGFLKENENEISSRKFDTSVFYSCIHHE